MSSDFSPALIRYMSGHAVDQSGIWAGRLTVSLVVWDITQSSLWLGLISFLSLAPMIVLAPAGGELADRFNKAALLASFKLVAAAGHVLLAGMVLAGATNPMLYAIPVALVGSATALGQGAAKIIVHDFMTHRNLIRGISMNSVLSNLAIFVGPAAAGAAIAAGGAGWALLGCGLSSLAHAVIVWSLRREVKTSGRARVLVPRESSWRTAYRAGLAPILVIHGTFALMWRPVLDLMPALGSLKLGGDSIQSAWLVSAIGIGAMVGGIALTWIRSNDPERVLRMTGYFTPLALIAFLHAPGLAASFVAGMVFGVGMIMRTASIQTIVQLAAPAERRGAITGLYLVVLHGSGAIGSVALGALSEFFDLRMLFDLLAIGVLILFVCLGRCGITPRQR